MKDNKNSELHYNITYSFKEDGRDFFELIKEEFIIFLKEYLKEEFKK